MNPAQVTLDAAAFSQAPPSEVSALKKMQEQQERMAKRDEKALKPEQLKMADKLTEQMKAEGEAAAIRAGGIVASNSLVLAVSSEAKFFRDQLPYYRQDPALFRERLRLDSVAQVLTNSTDKYFLPERADGQRRELRIQLNREPASTACWT